MLILLPYCPELPLCRDQARVICLCLVPEPCLLYFCLHYALAAFGLVQLAVPSLLENVSVLFCFFLSMFRWNSEGTSGKINDHSTKHYICFESQDPALNIFSIFFMCSFQLLLK